MKGLLRDPSDPAAMSTDARTQEIAAILAEGYLRLRTLRAAGPAPATEASETLAPEAARSPENDLEAVGDQSVHAPAVNGRRARARKEAR